MYPVSATFKDYIKRNTMSFSWHGTIVDAEENSYDISDENIAQNSGQITKRCSTNELSIGTACASELEMDLYLDVDRYKLFGAVVTLYFTLHMGSVDEDVPMGIFTISECNQSNGKLNIIAYDNMVKFENVTFSVGQNTDILSAYEWLELACEECDVELGSTSSDIGSLPNGSRKTGFADVVTDAKTWRDVLTYITTYVGGFAYIGRDGKLYVKTYNATSIDTIPASFRYSSNFSDYRTSFNAISAIYKNDGIQEYVDNENEDGLVLELGVNPFLQFTEQENRLSALQEIIDVWNDVYYVPFEVSMPIVPFYDIGDVLTFIDNQASEYDYGAITEIIYSIGGKMSVECTGDNPRLTMQDRFSKTVAGLSSDYNNGQEIGGKGFWLLHTENTSPITVGGTKTEVAEIEWKQTVDVQRLGLMFTCDGDLSDTAVVKVLITVDDLNDYEFEVTESKSLLGKRTYNSTCGFRVTGKGTHVAKVYMTVTDNALKWSDLA